jgi:predicted nucleic acid-binding protein
VALCDAGIFVALFDVDETDHTRCWDALRQFHGRLVTTWPVLTESFYLLEPGRRHERLWDFVLSQGLQVDDLSRADMARMRELMQKYSDLPMDLADASLVALGERLSVARIFTLDRRHFTVYRPRHQQRFEVLP